MTFDELATPWGGQLINRRPNRPGAVPASGSRPLTWLAMEGILSGLQIIFSVVLMLLVLLHSGKDAGLSGAFGVGTGAGPLGGGSLVERNLDRWTIVVALLWVANVIVLLKI